MEHKCDFNPDILLDYLTYDQGTDLINEMMGEAIFESEEAQLKKFRDEIQEARNFFKEQIDKLKEQTATKLMQMQKKNREALSTQDDIIDVISRELHKEAKKKSD